MARKKSTTKATPLPSDETVVFINNYPQKLCKSRTSKNNDASFISVHFRFNDKWASFTLPNSMVKPSTRRDGSLIESCFNLFLGQSHEQRTVSVKQENGEYEKIKMSCGDISHFIQTAREAYHAS